jgi:hypothetical protein
MNAIDQLMLPTVHIRQHLSLLHICLHLSFSSLFRFLNISQLIARLPLFLMYVRKSTARPSPRPVQTPVYNAHVSAILVRTERMHEGVGNSRLHDLCMKDTWGMQTTGTCPPTAPRTRGIHQHHLNHFLHFP